MAASTGAINEFDETTIDYMMEQAYQQGGIEALSDVAQQYGVTFQPETI
jgi:hypothetical protein